MRLLRLACAALLVASPSAAWADGCGDFGALGEFVALGAGSAAGLLATAASLVVLRDLEPEAPLLAPLLSGAVLGGVVTPGVFYGASLGSGCYPRDAGALFGLQMGLSAGMAVAGVAAGHRLFRDAPVSAAAMPWEGGGVVVVSGRF